MNHTCNLVGANNVADQDIVCAVVAQVGRLPGQVACILEDQIMRFEQARNLHRDFFAIARRPLEAGHLGNVVGHRDAYPAQSLDPLGEQVDQLDLFAEMLIEEQMKLIKRGAANLPVRFLVKIPKADRVGEQEVQAITDPARVFSPMPMRQIRNDGAELLNRFSILMPVGVMRSVTFRWNFFQGMLLIASFLRIILMLRCLSGSFSRFYAGPMNFRAKGKDASSPEGLHEPSITLHAHLGLNREPRPQQMVLVLLADW